MRRLLTERQAEIVDLAGGLADVFAGRAAQHDRDNTFPCRELAGDGRGRLPGARRPGGAPAVDADVLEILLAQERLAQGCGSTALAVLMHLTTSASFRSQWRRTNDARAERFLRGAATGEIVLASCTSEAGFGGAIEDCATVATPVDGGFRLDGKKIFFTESDVATHFTTVAKLHHPSLGPQMLFLNGIPIDSPGISLERTWTRSGCAPRSRTT